jgi:hypothetical protein
VTKVAFEEIEQTNEYAETHYFGQKNVSSFSNLVASNLFWTDYAEYLANADRKSN